MVSVGPNLATIFFGRLGVSGPSYSTTYFSLARKQPVSSQQHAAAPARGRGAHVAQKAAASAEALTSEGLDPGLRVGEGAAVAQALLQRVAGDLAGARGEAAVADRAAEAVRVGRRPPGALQPERSERLLLVLRLRVDADGERRGDGRDRAALKQRPHSAAQHRGNRQRGEVGSQGAAGRAGGGGAQILPEPVAL